ncbi:MAG TPA: hypothetical protein VIG75_10220, partial [Citricoccus sp.]
MTSTAAAPLPVLYVPPRDTGPSADLLLHEVAACVAAVGHRLWVQTASRPGDVPQRDPVMVLSGDPGARHPAVSVALDGDGRERTAPGVLSLPRDAHRLCRLLARSADPRLPGRAVVLAHHGPGPGGDGAWPGLSWGLTLLLGGPGRGVLVDLRDADAALAHRLRAVSDPVAHEPVGPRPSPGPGLARRLPAAGGVRWWRPAGLPEDTPSVIGPALDTFRWAVLDVGDDTARAAGLAAEGWPVLAVRARDGAGVLHLPGAGGEHPLGPVPWTGASPADWARSARRRESLDLAVRLTTALTAAPTVEAATASAADALSDPTTVRPGVR